MNRITSFAVDISHLWVDSKKFSFTLVIVGGVYAFIEKSAIIALFYRTIIDKLLVDDLIRHNGERCIHLSQ